MFQQDNCTYHKSKVAYEFLETFLGENDLEFLRWPARSPDFSPIEFIWADLQRLVDDRAASIKSKATLELIVREAWDELTPPERLRKYVLHAYHNIKKSLAVGGSAQY